MEHVKKIAYQWKRPLRPWPPPPTQAVADIKLFYAKKIYCIVYMYFVYVFETSKLPN